MARGRDEGKSVLVRVPRGMYREIEELVKRGLYRAPADFFYVAGQKELERLRNNGVRSVFIDSDGDCEVVQEG